MPIWVSLSGLNTNCPDENSSWEYLVSLGDCGECTFIDSIITYILPCSFYSQVTVIPVLSMNPKLLVSSDHLASKTVIPRFRLIVRVRISHSSTKQDSRLSWHCRNYVASCNIYMQSYKTHNVVLMSKFIQHLCELDMFRTSSVHYQERFVQAVYADYVMCCNTE